MNRRSLLASLLGAPFAAAISRGAVIDAPAPDSPSRAVGIKFPGGREITIICEGKSITIKALRFDVEKWCDRIEIGGGESVPGLLHQTIRIKCHFENTPQLWEPMTSLSPVEVLGMDGKHLISYISTDDMGITDIELTRSGA